MEKYIDIYNKKEKCNIKARLLYNLANSNTEHFFIFCHGFCSGKGSDSVTLVANKLLEHNISSIAFDFPGHVDSLQGTDKLNVDVCISYIDSVIEYIRNTYGNDTHISFYAISFGAYILLNKLIGDSSKYKHIVLRSPAFNMKDILVNCLIKESFEQFKSTGYAPAGHGGKIVVPYSFYEDLINHDLYNTYTEKRKILIIQGLLDDTAPISDTYKFIQNKPEIELVEMENTNHHFEPDEILKSTDIMLKKINIV